MVLGIDEVGRGPWAGPLVVGAVVLSDAKIEGLNDSKKLSAKKREKLAYEIKEKALAVATGWVSSGELDEYGLSEALKLATRRAVEKIDVEYDKVIIDGTIKLIDDERVVTLPKADGLIPAVSAASIVAKVARDMYMKKLGEKFPGYGFENHMGYGTADHKKALEKLGVIKEHRRSFRPVAKVLGLPDKNKSEKNTKKNTTEIGNMAENLATEYLLNDGHEIIARNWKCKICEIDIISAKDDDIFFTEVKYRAYDRFGSGIDAVDEHKENQVRLAAEYYLTVNKLLEKVQPHISAIAFSGKKTSPDLYIKDI